MTATMGPCPAGHEVVLHLATTGKPPPLVERLTSRDSTAAGGIAVCRIRRFIMVSSIAAGFARASSTPVEDRSRSAGAVQRARFRDPALL